MRVLITGVTGQDGSYLAEHLIAGGHTVFGMIHGQRNPKRAWLGEHIPDVIQVEGDLLDQSSLQSLIKNHQPDVIYNLGALTFVGMSWHQPSLMTEVTGLGLLRLLEAVRLEKPDTRVVQASTSEMFGSSPAPQSESTPFHPRSPYGVAKLFAHQTCVNYRESYDMHVSTAIMFNHESPRRGLEFVTRKVCHAAALIASRKLAGGGLMLRLGTLTTSRDWGWAPEYVQALPLMAARDEPDDFVLATGKTHTIQDLCELAFAYFDLDWRDHVVPGTHENMRPADVNLLCGDASKARAELGWVPESGFYEVVHQLLVHAKEEIAR